MGKQGRSAIPRLALLATIAALGLLSGAGAARSRPPADSEATSAASAPSCRKSCRGLGIDKVRAGQEHCGLIPRETKDEALDAACGLADSHREALQEQAEEQARAKCARQHDRAACLCRTELRAWQNVYTHVLSQNCWAECGWALLIDCRRRPPADGG